MRNGIPTESEEQQALFRWAAYETNVMPELALLYHVPNEGQRSRATGGRLKAEGLKSGVPDICLPVARSGFHSLYIELKRVKGGKLSESQADWLKRLSAEGNFCTVCKGWDAARQTITDYLLGRIGREEDENEPRNSDWQSGR